MDNTQCKCGRPNYEHRLNEKTGQLGASLDGQCPAYQPSYRPADSVPETAECAFCISASHCDHPGSLASENAELKQILTDAVNLGKAQADEYDRVWQAMGMGTDETTVDDVIAKWYDLTARLRRCEAERAVLRDEKEPSGKFPVTPAFHRLLADHEALVKKNERNFRWAYTAVVYLAQILLQGSNDSRENENDWPAGQTWDEINQSSREIFLRKARSILSISHDEFLEPIRSGEIDVDEIFNTNFAVLQAVGEGEK